MTRKTKKSALLFFSAVSPEVDPLIDDFLGAVMAHSAELLVPSCPYLDNCRGKILRLLTKKIKNKAWDI